MGCATSREVIALEPQKTVFDKCKQPIQDVNHGLSSCVDIKLECAEDGSSVNQKTTYDINRRLTTTQQKQIKKTWSIVSKDAVAIGIKVFLKIFDICPSLKDYFPFRDENIDALPSNRRFCQHAGRFMQILDSLVNGMSDPENMVVPVLHNLGRFHTKQGAFKPDDFNIFPKAVIVVWQQELGNRFDKSTTEAWNVLMEDMLRWLKEGYTKGQQEIYQNGLP